MTGLAESTQWHADMGDMCAFYGTLKTLYGPSHQIKAPLRSSDGSTLLTKKPFSSAVWSRGLGSLSEADQSSGAVSPMLLALHPWQQRARPRVKRRSPQESQPAQHKVNLASGAAALG